MFEWIPSLDAQATAALARKRAAELEYILAYKKGLGNPPIFRAR